MTLRDPIGEESVDDTLPRRIRPCRTGPDEVFGYITDPTQKY